MDKKTLEKKGTLVFEKDIYDGFIYLYTKKYYVLDNKMYVSEEHSNANRYTGSNDTYIISDDVKSDLDSKSDFYWYSLGLDDDDIEELERIIKEVE